MQKKKLSLAQKAIRPAFLSLLKSRNFYSIKTSEIIKTSGVSRSTFYAHYKDKFDLLEKIQNDFLDGLQEIFEYVRDANHGQLVMQSNCSMPHGTGGFRRL